MIVSSPGAGNLQALFFINEDTGWVCGNQIVARTNNGGLDWTQQGPTNSRYRAISFIGPDTGYMAEAWGGVYWTENGGATWSVLYNFPSGDIFWLYDLHFTDGLNGWAAGAYQVSGTNTDGRVMRTRDGGITWTRQFRTAQSLYAVEFSDTLNGWCAGRNGILYKTADGGTAWSNELRGVTSTLYSVHFTDSLHGWAAGGSNYDSSIVLRTVNGGRTWVHQSTPVRSARLKAVAFVDHATGWVAGDNGALRKTVDSGATWTAQSSPSGSADYNQLFFLDSLYGWAVAGNSFSTGAAVRTQNGGASWTTVSLPVTRPMEGAFFFDTSRGFLVGWSGTILKTTNGGQTWTNVGDSSFGTLMDVHFMDPARGWITGNHKILMTRDSGATWQVFHEEGLYMTHSYFTDTATGYAVSYSNSTPFSGYILKTMDGGRNWQRESMNQGGMFQAGGIFFVNNDMGWVVSGGGTILKTDNGGGVQWSIPAVDLISPDSGGVLEMDTTIEITWVADDPSGITGVSFWLSIDNGKTFQFIDSVSGNPGTWTWNVLADTASAQCLVEVRARDAEGYVGKDRSGQVFSITGVNPGITRLKAPAARPLIALSSNPSGNAARVYLNLPPAFEGERFRLSVYDIRGRLLETLAQGRARAGACVIPVRTRGAAGVRMIVLEAGENVRVIKKWVGVK
jgi:photosystem II stability/assembly factor-like uncharacterized protein